jgi:hypothetical protein
MDLARMQEHLATHGEGKLIFLFESQKNVETSFGPAEDEITEA